MIYPPQTFRAQKRKETTDGLGGSDETWGYTLSPIRGYLDMSSGTDKNGAHFAEVEQSTHILIIPDYFEGLTDDMRIVDSKGRAYQITYVDDPVGIGHHLEVYLEYQEGGEDSD